jgi:hypothetical protein
MLATSLIARDRMFSRSRGAVFGQSLNCADRLTKGDIAVLRFLAAIELIEGDLWQQYEEVGGVSEGSQTNYQLALQFLDADGSQHISSGAMDEIGHAALLNAHLESQGVDPVDLDEYRTLPGSSAAGVLNIGRLTNLMHLNFDTSWFAQYRRTNALELQDHAQLAAYLINVPAIPRTEADLVEPAHTQAIANTAVFHLAFIEHACSCVYASVCRMVKRAEVLNLALGIGSQEAAHFLEWADFASKAVHGMPFRLDGAQVTLIDQVQPSLDFDLVCNKPVLQPAFLLAVRCEFIRKDPPLYSVSRPIDDRLGGAVATIHSFTENGLFVGQSKNFLRSLTKLAQEADAAMRG